MGLYWMAKLYNAKPVPKAVPLVGSVGGFAWQVEYQGKAGYAWQALGPVAKGLGLSPGFYQAVIDSYYWAREKNKGGWPSTLTAVIGAFVLTAEHTVDCGPTDCGIANVVWPGGAVRIAYMHNDYQKANYWWTFKEHAGEEDTGKVGIGKPLWTEPDDELLGVTLVGLQLLAGKGAGKALEGKA